MIDNKKYFVLFECCQIVKGATRSIIVDIQRRTYRFFPNELLDFLCQSQYKSIGEVKASYQNQHDEAIDANLELLEKEEFIFFTDHPEWFPAMSLEWDEPKKITNGIIDIDFCQLHDMNNIWSQFSDLGCEHIQLRFFSDIGIATIEKIMRLIKCKRIISIEIVMPYSKKVNNHTYIDLVYKYPRIFVLHLYAAEEAKFIFESPTGMGHVIKMKNKINNKAHCGLMGHDFFNIDIKTFTESIHHNSCLNRKISIDTNGNIKNCPSMTESYGNIKDTTLAEAIEKPGFKKYWNINKDQIAVCKDCEFRHICTDCRAYTEDPHDNSGPDGTNLSKPLKCGYNPYTGEWAEWSTNPLKQKAIDFYEMRELVMSGK